MSRLEPRDGGSHVHISGGGSSRALAAGTGDATEVDGPWIDRLGYDSCRVGVVGRATLTEAATLTVAFNLQDSIDSSGSDAADFGDAYAAATQATGGAGGSTEEIQAAASFNLRGAKRWIRLQHTPNLSAGATDVSTLAGAVVLIGKVEEPVS